MKNRHHFVPQFYLRRFASQRRRIHLFNLRREAAFESVGLRDQCFKHRFYGKTPEVENAFASLEDVVAPVLKRVDSERVLPAIGTQDYNRLIAFIALQLLRTTAAVKRVLQSSQKLASAAFNGPPPPEFAVSEEQALVLSLSTLPHLMLSLNDLTTHVIEAPTDTRFVTCDNPIFRYNQYCEGIRGSGVLGGLCRGLQLFMPISPELCVLFYDAAVYKVGRGGTAPSTKATSKDVRTINLTQLVAADENIYFSHWTDRDVVQALAMEAKRHRSQHRVRLNEAVEDGNEQSVLLHQYEQMPALQLALSFATVRRNARRVPLSDRAQMWRKLAPESDPLDQSGLGQARHFRVRTRR